MKVGIIGFGKMGQTRARAIEETSAGRITKVYDPFLSPNCAYEAAPSIEAIVQDPSIDAVFICLPNYLNRPTTIAALQAKKHVFCEKPPAFNSAEVEEIADVERASGRVLMYGFNHRHHAAVVKMKALIDDRRYGRVLWMRGRYGKSVDADYLTTWRADKELAGGGILIDQGIHMLDLFLYLGGASFDEVYAMVSSQYWKMDGIEDNVFAMMRDTTSGLEVSFHSTMTQWRHLFSLEVFLERGYLVLNGLKTSSGTYGKEELSIAQNRATAPAATWDMEERMTFDVDISWNSEVRHFMDVIAGKSPHVYGTSAQALAVMRLVDEIYSQDCRVSHVRYRGLTAVR